MPETAEGRGEAHERMQDVMGQMGLFRFMDKPPAVHEDDWEKEEEGHSATPSEDLSCSEGSTCSYDRVATYKEDQPCPQEKPARHMHSLVIFLVTGIITSSIVCLCLPRASTPSSQKTRQDAPAACLRTPPSHSALRDFFPVGGHFRNLVEEGSDSGGVFRAAFVGGSVDEFLGEVAEMSVSYRVEVVFVGHVADRAEVVPAAATDAAARSICQKVGEKRREAEELQATLGRDVNVSLIDVGIREEEGDCTEGQRVEEEGAWVRSYMSEPSSLAASRILARHGNFDAVFVRDFITESAEPPSFRYSRVISNLQKATERRKRKASGPSSSDWWMMTPWHAASGAGPSSENTKHTSLSFFTLEDHRCQVGLEGTFPDTAAVLRKGIVPSKPSAEIFTKKERCWKTGPYMYADHLNSPARSACVVANDILGKSSRFEAKSVNLVFHLKDEL